MSNDENSNESVETAGETKEAASKMVGNMVSKAMELKESNPKVFFGAIAALVLIILASMMMGGDSGKKHLPVATQSNLEVGQTYTLDSANSYDASARVRLVSVPGSLAAYDDTEADDREGNCKHITQGTKVKVLQLQQAFTTTRFVQVEMLGGECSGQKGWTISTNLK